MINATWEFRVDHYQLAYCPQAIIDYAIIAIAASAMSYVLCGTDHQSFSPETTPGKKQTKTVTIF